MDALSTVAVHPRSAPSEAREFSFVLRLKTTEHARGFNELVVSRDGAAGSKSVALPDGMSPNRIPSVQLCVHKRVTAGWAPGQSTRSTWLSESA